MVEGAEITVNTQGETPKENPVSAVHRVTGEIRASLGINSASGGIEIPEDASKKIDWLTAQASSESSQGIRLNALHDVRKIAEGVSRLPLLRDRSQPLDPAEADNAITQNNQVAERLLRIPSAHFDDPDPIVSYEAMNDFGNMAFDFGALPGFNLGEELRQEVVAKITTVAETTKADGVRVEALNLLTQLGAAPKE